MYKNRQAELIKHMSKNEILLNLLVTQLLFFVVAVVFSYFLLDDGLQFLTRMKIDSLSFFLGVVSGFVIVIIDLLLWRYLPSSWVDDGGINERIFTSLSVMQIFMVTLLIAFCEEVLFRGTIQPKIGLFWTSILFAVMHIRYINKIVLVSSAMVISFYLGWLFELTGSLVSTILAHFLIDFILGLLLHFKPFSFLKNDA